MLNDQARNKCGVLYIDDEEMALKYFRRALADRFEVFTASSAREGLEVLRREADRIGIILSDQRMPETLGAEVLAAIREEFPSKVRILTTAYSDLKSAIDAVNKGHIYQYVTKPWDTDQLIMVLQRAADYYAVLTERNELLALKMTTLQRLICGDSLNGSFCSSRRGPIRPFFAARSPRSSRRCRRVSRAGVPLDVADSAARISTSRRSCEANTRPGATASPPCARLRRQRFPPTSHRISARRSRR
jgi:ActR/RegA family two-component response regulator